MRRSCCAGVARRQPAPTAVCVARRKSKCGTIFASTSSAILRASPAWIAGSCLIAAITSVETALMRASGASSSAKAVELAPDALIKAVSTEVIAAIRQDPAIQAGDARKIAELVEAKIVPHFDFRRATQTAVGAGWRRATPAQQERLIEEFRTLVLRTYSGALASYRDQLIEFRPLRVRPDATEVTVD